MGHPNSKTNEPYSIKKRQKKNELGWENRLMGINEYSGRIQYTYDAGSERDKSGDSRTIAVNGKRRRLWYTAMITRVMFLLLC
jgi:hypothetical protein